MDISTEDYKRLKEIMAIECYNCMHPVPGQPEGEDCGKFNRYLPYRCTCGQESRRLEAFEALAEEAIQKYEAKNGNPAVSH